jgi:hypothetical protein
MPETPMSLFVYVKQGPVTGLELLLAMAELPKRTVEPTAQSIPVPLLVDMLCSMFRTAPAVAAKPAKVLLVTTLKLTMVVELPLATRPLTLFSNRTLWRLAWTDAAGAIIVPFPAKLKAPRLRTMVSSTKSRESAMLGAKRIPLRP